FVFFFSSRRRHTRLQGDWSSDVCSSDLFRLSSQLPIIGRSHFEVFPELPDRWKATLVRCLGGATEKCDEDLYVGPDGMQSWLRRSEERRVGKEWRWGGAGEPENKERRDA